MITLQTESMSVLRKAPQKWKDYIELTHIDEGTIYILNKLFVNCEKVAIEYPYYDNEYLSTYYLFYAKKYSAFPKECYRIHLFKDGNYCGFFTPLL